ncbi:hypothetical protein JTE90_001172 [Oedothorax gibbosus]|uniref:DUF4371 domain-containing protein n=1 Tax=Oedothorax gibbosus TaxID=931172 RepID=A0AAV6VK08_9ARAC|nr:hypothetical protein JTE90_001172 [Oedothorax gibbosus]
MVEQHQKSNAHQNALAASRKGQLGPLQKNVLKLEAKEIQQPHHLFKIAFHIGKQEMPFSAFRDEIRLLRSVGVDISETYNNDKQASTFISFISEEIKEEIRASLEKSNFFSIMADGSTDRGTCEEEIIYIQFLENGEVVTKFVTLQPLKTADANGIEHAISDAMLNYLRLSQENTKTKLVACVLDGTPANFGEKNGAFIKLKRDGRPHLLGIHCCAHRLELAVKDVAEKSAIYLKFEEALNDLYECNL